MGHELLENEGTFLCRRCGSLWDYPRPMSGCPAKPSLCPGIDEGVGTHHYGTDGHCHHCGTVDRG